MRRSLVPILIIMFAFVAFPFVLHKLFPPSLPAAQFVVQKPPRQLTDFTFLDGSGRSLTLKDFRGTFILINVWATWCPPCKEEMASLDHLALLLVIWNASSPHYRRALGASKGERLWRMQM